MYACIPENGGGFFEGVCTPSNATANFCDPPLPPLHSPPALFQPCSKSNTGVSLRAFYFLVSHQPIGECDLARDIKKIGHVAYETYPCGRCINTNHPLAFGHIVAHRAQGEVTGRSEWTRRKGSNRTRLESYR
jgi:hypothetical protein